MNDSTQPFQQPTRTETPLCCTIEQATAWLNAIAEMALAGDADGLRALPTVIDHFLAAWRQAGVPR